MAGGHGASRQIRKRLMGAGSSHGTSNARVDPRSRSLAGLEAGRVATRAPHRTGHARLVAIRHGPVGHVPGCPSCDATRGGRQACPRSSAEAGCPASSRLDAGHPASICRQHRTHGASPAGPSGAPGPARPTDSDGATSATRSPASVLLSRSGRSCASHSGISCTCTARSAIVVVDRRPVAVRHRLAGRRTRTGLGATDPHRSDGDASGSRPAGIGPDPGDRRRPDSRDPGATGGASDPGGSRRAGSADLTEPAAGRHRAVAGGRPEAFRDQHHAADTLR